MRNEISTDAVWGLMCEGCNAAEIAEWFRVDRFVAVAWMSRASREFARAAA